MDQLRVIQECNQQGDNCNDVITGGSLIHWKDRQKGVGPAAASILCQMLPFSWIGQIVRMNMHLAVVDWSRYGQKSPR